MRRVNFSSKGRKDYENVELRLKKKIDVWVKRINEIGLLETRRIWANSYKDHPLKGEKEGRRSIYLNRQWRLEYTEQQDLESSEDESLVVIDFIQVEEIHPHEYKK